MNRHDVLLLLLPMKWTDVIHVTEVRHLLKQNSTSLKTQRNLRCMAFTYTTLR